ncbi:MAG: BtrH N-terminal domain-containing protein [Candidatus Thorarchaeota archaeon]|nr:MAG: BtrH N-terminal domain-containing protein [Candidatus Thorarchaeota archaeon]
MKDSKKEFEPAGIEDDVIMLDFEHTPGGLNCQTSAVRKLLLHYGHEISEEMFVGIASGLGFVYWFQKGMFAPIVGGMNSGRFPGLVGRAIQRLGGDFTVLKSSSTKRAHQQLKSVLKTGQPAFVCADIAYLPHLGTSEDDHFGQHTFLVYGINEPDDIVYISDRFDVPLTMPATQLQRARASKFHPFPARNQMIQFTMPESLPDLRRLIPKAIEENVDFMFNAPIKNLGLNGILKWREMLPKYPKMINNPNWLLIGMIHHYIYIETGGSGGAIFRRIYSTFLREAGELMEEDHLLDASSEFEEISDVWTNIANSFLSDEYDSLAEIRKIHWTNNSDLEKKGPKALNKVKKQSDRLPSLMEQAIDEAVPYFSRIIEPIRDLLAQVHDMETKALSSL